MGRQGSCHRPGRQPAHADPALTEDELTERLRALAHAERRRIVAACLDRPQAAGDLAARSGLAAATVSEHLKVLRKAGLVVLDRRGRFWLYRTDREAVALVAGTVGALVARER